MRSGVGWSRVANFLTGLGLGLCKLRLIPLHEHPNFHCSIEEMLNGILVLHRRQNQSILDLLHVGLECT